MMGKIYGQHGLISRYQRIMCAPMSNKYKIKMQLQSTVSLICLQIAPSCTRPSVGIVLTMKLYVCLQSAGWAVYDQTSLIK